MGVELSPIAMFETPTISGLVHKLHLSRANANGIAASPIKRLARE
jgi:hypothetical protein